MKSLIFTLCWDPQNVRSCLSQKNNANLLLICCLCFYYFHDCCVVVQFSPTTNLGFLIQARLVDSYDPTLDPDSFIIGTWDEGPDHKPVLCKNSSGDEVPVRYYV